MAVATTMSATTPTAACPIVLAKKFVPGDFVAGGTEAADTGTSFTTLWPAMATLTLLRGRPGTATETV